ncbi:MAG: hypothetical protein HN544_04020 [Euryarchaeota archaeon]|nr:hypothetical protein [Euryarchaeota archaeon]
MKTKFTLRDLFAVVLGLAFINVGVDHFVHPEWYEPIVPKILPSATFWVLLSGFFEALLGLLLIIPRTRSLASVGIAWMLVVLYWANFNMWYNDIPLNGTKYDDIWHVVRFVIQIILILAIAWVGEITPFKGKESKIDTMDVFKGRITSSGFESGDRIVVGAWKESPFGEFTDIMWAKKDGSRILIAPTKEVADYVDAMYSFDEIKIQNVGVVQQGRSLSVSCDSMDLDFEWNRGWPIPFKRSLFFIATVELLFAKIFFGTQTHGVTKNQRKEWYAIDRVSKLTKASATIDGINAGELRPLSEPCKFGFSEAPKKPSSCEVRTHIL